MDSVKDRLITALNNLELLAQQLRETQDYSKQSELTFLLKDLVEEQISKENIHEDTSYSAGATR